MLGNACIPIPSEVTMVYAGYLVSQGPSSSGRWCWSERVASLVGSWLAWAAGSYGVDSVLVRSDRSRRHMTQAHDWFARYGAPTVFLSRMVPVVRTFISLPAGIARMPFSCILDLHRSRARSSGVCCSPCWAIRPARTGASGIAASAT